MSIHHVSQVFAACGSRTATLILAMPKFIIACLACLGCLSPLLEAQGETTSAIVGPVIDPAGGAIADAAVTIVSTGTGSKRAAKTDNAGRFSFTQLSPGAYAVT